MIRVRVYRALADVLWRVARVIEETSWWLVDRSDRVADRMLRREAP